MDEKQTFILSTIVFFLFMPLLNWAFKRAKFITLIERIPGPKAYPIIGTTYQFFGVKREEVFKIIDNRAKVYTDGIHRIWAGVRPEIRIFKAEYVEKVIGSSTKHNQKGELYNFIVSWLGEGLLIAKGDRWFHHRKIITPTFHFNILENFCEVFGEKSNILINKLEKFSETKEIFDVYPFIQRLALDIICVTAMGTDIQVQNNPNQEYAKYVYEMGELIMQRLVRPWLYPEIIFKRSALGKRHSHHLKILHGFTERIIRDRKLVLADERIKNRAQKPTADDDDNDVHVGRKKRRLAFLDLLLQANENNDLTDHDIREEVDTFMFEGHDTTTAAIAWSLFLIGLHDDVQSSIVDEIDTIFNGSDRLATIHDLNEMKYLERVIKETLRLYPSVGFIGRRLSEDIELGEYTIPKDCTVVCQIYHLHRDASVFPDPNRFDPDRFTPENSSQRHPFAYIPFSAGPRNCIGQRFAMLEEKAILSTILRKFKIKSVDTVDDVLILSELIMKPNGGIRLKIERRQ